MKSKIFIFGVVLALVGCESGSDETPTPNGTAITFQFQQEQPQPEWPTRATHTVDATLNKIGVFAYSHSATGGWGAVENSSPKADYFLNKPIIKKQTTPTVIWGYDGVVKYWPDATKQLSFFAYTPYSDVNSSIILSPTTVSPNGSPKISYTTSTDILQQVDLMWDSKTNQSGGLVSFQMKHALASVEFLIDFSGLIGLESEFTSMKIEKLTIFGVNTKGTFNLATGKWLDISTPAALSLSINRGLANAEFKFVDFSNPDYVETPKSISGASTPQKDGFLLLIPQALTSDPTIVIEMSVINAANEYLTGEESFVISTEKNQLVANTNHKFILPIGSGKVRALKK